MIYTFVVVDFDEIYDLEPEDEEGVHPLVYLVPENQLTMVVDTIRQAKNLFMDDNDCSDCIGDIFEQLLTEQDIFFRMIGEIKLAFGERQGMYLSGMIHHEIV